MMSEEGEPATEQTIELDCAPFTPRPDSFLAEVLSGTGIPVKDPVSTCFGNWKWDYSDIDPLVWDIAKPVIAERIKALYHAGHIRYGSW